MQRVGALGGDQAGELVAAGHHHQAARRAGQQRADLVGVAGVVEHDQHPPAGQQAAVQARPAPSRPAGIRCGGTPSASRNPRTASAGSSAAPGRVEAAQVDVELAVGEPVGDPVRPVHGQGGLADAGRAGRSRRYRRGRRRCRAAQQGVEVAQVRHPAGERGDVGWELSRHRMPRRRRAGAAPVPASRTRYASASSGPGSTPSSWARRAAWRGTRRTPGLAARPTGTPGSAVPGPPRPAVARPRPPPTPGEPRRPRRRRPSPRRSGLVRPAVHRAARRPWDGLPERGRRTGARPATGPVPDPAARRCGRGRHCRAPPPRRRRPARGSGPGRHRPSRMLSAYPSPMVGRTALEARGGRSGSRRRRRCFTWVWMMFVALGGECSPHSESMRSARVIGRPAASASNAKTARRRAGPRSSSMSPCHPRTRPRTWIRNSTAVTDVNLAGRLAIRPSTDQGESREHIAQGRRNQGAPVGSWRIPATHTDR